MKTCIISFASKGREDYPKALKRNIKELRKHYDGDVFYFCPELAGQMVEDVEILAIPEGMPDHKDVPYGFKPFLFNLVKGMGYDQVIWLDSTIVVNRLLRPLFNAVNKRGVLSFHNLGHDLNDWISDKAAQKLNLDLNEPIMQIMACVTGFDFSTDIGLKIFNEWLDLSKDGESFQNNPSTRPTHKAHRHDQAVLSGLLYNNNMPIVPYGALCYQPHDKTKEYGEDIYFINKAI